MKLRKILITSTLIVFPCLWCTSCGCNGSASDNSLKYILDIFKKKPESTTLVGSNDVIEFNRQVREQISNNNELIKKDIIYRSFNFINTDALKIGSISYTKSDETLLDLYERGIVDFSIKISNYDFTKKISTDAYDFKFDALFQVVYSKEYVMERFNIPKGVTINCIVEIEEGYLLDLELSKLPESLDWYQQDGSNDYIWSPYLPSYVEEGQYYPFVGLIQTSIDSGVNYAIDFNQISSVVYNQFIYQIEQ